MNNNSEQYPVSNPEIKYDNMSGEELVLGYLSDKVPSQAVMRRALSEIELSDDAKVSMPGLDVTLEDYIEVARDHGAAIPMLLKFVAAGDKKNKNDIEAMKKIVLARLGRL